jgi:hypothetical protein
MSKFVVDLLGKTLETVSESRQLATNIQCAASWDKVVDVGFAPVAGRVADDPRDLG